PVHAQDLLQIWQAALQRDPIHAATRSARSADQQLVPQARAQLMPRISAAASGEVTDLRRISGLDQSYRDRGAGWDLLLTQPVVDLGKWDQLKQTEYVARSAEVALRQSYQDLILRVSQA